MNKLVALLGSVILVGLVIALNTLFVKLGWQYSISEIFQLPQLTWGQSFALTILIETLTGHGVKIDKQ